MRFKAVFAISVLALVVLGVTAPAPAAPTCNGNPVTILGTVGNDTITGTGGQDVIYAGRGDDVVHGGGGSDWICGGPGNDVLYGGDGTNHLFGQDGNDRLIGGRHADFLHGGDGNDTLDPRRGARYEMYGGSGNDRFFVSDGLYCPDPFQYNKVWGGGGRDRIDFRKVTSATSLDMSGTVLWYIYYLGGSCAGHVAGIEHFFGSAQKDIFRGTAGRNVMKGFGGDDELYGYDGNDRIFGGAGNDFLSGMGHIDYLDGGPGSDICVDTIGGATMVSCP